MNNWFERYYVSKSIEGLSKTAVEDYSFSNMMYDQHKGISHALLPYSENPQVTRFVSDVEICMTSDPAVTSYFSSQHRDMLKKQLMSQPHTLVSDGPHPTDEQLMENGGIVSMERDEIVSASKANMSRLDSELPMPSPAPAPASAPVSEPPKSE